MGNALQFRPKTSKFQSHKCCACHYAFARAGVQQREAMAGAIGLSIAEMAEFNKANEAATESNSKAAVNNMALWGGPIFKAINGLWLVYLLLTYICSFY